MNQKFDWKKFLLKSMSYLLVAVLASAMTLVLWGGRSTKLTELEKIIDLKFIGEMNLEEVRDAAAGAMVDALGDRWSYYISAKDYAAYQESKDNAYVGIGVTIVGREDGTGFDIKEVTPGGSAQEGGILPGDVLIEAEGKSATELDMNSVKDIIRGEVGTKVTVAVLRNGEKKTFILERREVKVPVATGQMLPGNIGLVRIANFNTGCSKETIAAVEELRKQGATALIFDVRNNPGGYVNEMVKVLDYLLPEGILFRELNYRGNTGERHSDAACVELPMAVLVNGSSYSAAEFFAAALEEYDWATVVGEPTTGKGYYQNTIKLSDGSAVNLSTGKYFTPKGINLTDVGGLKPKIEVKVDKEIAALIYAQLLPVAEDPQIQAAVKYLQEN